MADLSKDDVDSRVYTMGSDNQQKSYPAKPTTMDYLKEAFLPTDQRAQLEAIRNAKAKAGY